MAVSGITRAEFEARQETARRLAREANLDLLVVVGSAFFDRPGALAYLTNHYPPFPSTEFTTAWRGSGYAALVLPVKGTATLVVGHPAYRSDLVAADKVRVGGHVGREIAAAVGESGRGKRVGLVGSDVAPVALYEDIRALTVGAEWEMADDLIYRQRRVKSAAEHAALIRSAEVADHGLRAAQAAVGFEVREDEVCAAGSAAAMEAGADFVRYLRVHSGPWSAWGSRWPQAMRRALQKSDLVTLDLIGAAEGYAFDVLRTTVVGYDLLPEQRRLLNTVLRTLARVTDAVRPGVAAGELAALGLRMLEEAGYGEHASRFVGHGIGIETVEAPTLMREDSTVLEEGMVLCIEPAVFIPGWGGASLEDEVIVRDGPAEVITRTAWRLWE